MSTEQTSPLNVEPGLLSLLRAYTTVMFVLMTLGLLDWHDGPLPEYDTVLLWGLSAVGCILLYAQRIWPRFLGYLLLPLSLVLMTFGIIAADAVTLWLKVNIHGVNELTNLDAGRLSVWLLPPLFLVSTQYGWRGWVAFICVAACVPGLLAMGMDLPSLMIVQQFEEGWIRFILFGLTGLLSVWVAREQRNYRQQLAEKNYQLVAYTSTLEQLAVARERNRLARELHDTLAHTLSAVNVQLSALEVLLQKDPKQAADRVNKIQDLTRSGIQETRRALHDLRTQAIDELGMWMALQQLARQAAERAGTSLQVELPQNPPTHEIPPHIEQQVYRIAEEAFNNTVRHASASRIELSLKLTKNVLCMTISDNGIGFIQDHVTLGEGMGIRGMYERATLINGKLDIGEHRGQGTQVSLTVPLDRIDTLQETSS